MNFPGFLECGQKPGSNSGKSTPHSPHGTGNSGSERTADDRWDRQAPRSTASRKERDQRRLETTLSLVTPLPAASVPVLWDNGCSSGVEATACRPCSGRCPDGVCADSSPPRRCRSRFRVEKKRGSPHGSFYNCRTVPEESVPSAGSSISSSYREPCSDTAFHKQGRQSRPETMPSENLVQKSYSRGRRCRVLLLYLVGSRATFDEGLLPGFFYPFVQFSDTANRQFLLIPQIKDRASTRS